MKRDLWDAKHKCTKCNEIMKKRELVVESIKVRGWECPRCKEAVLHPEDAQKIDTSTWQTYRNEEFGFELKYPGDYFIVHPSLEEFSISGLALVVNLESELFPMLRILVKQLSEVQYNAHVEYIHTLRGFKEITIGDTPAFQYITCGSAACSWVITFQRVTDQYEILPLMSDEFDGTEIPEITNQILSTFRFVE